MKTTRPRSSRFWSVALLGLLALAGCADPAASAVAPEVSATLTQSSPVPLRVPADAVMPKQLKETGNTAPTDPFWLVAANVAVSPALDPESFDQLAAESDEKLIGSIRGLAPSAGADSFASVRLLVQPHGSEATDHALTVVLDYPVIVTRENSGTVLPELPDSPVLWLLRYDETTNTYYCTQAYYCAFVDTQFGIRSATLPNTDLHLVWADFAAPRISELAQG